MFLLGILILLLAGPGCISTGKDLPPQVEEGPQKKESGPDPILAGRMGDRLDEKLTPLIERTMKEHAIPGLSIGVVFENKIVYAKGFGYEDITTKIPVTISTIFHTASISKTFVATAIMQLVERDKVDLDAPVIEYLPYFKLEGEGYREITIRQMLGHVSGMPDTNDYEWDDPRYDEDALEEFVRSLSKEKNIFSPGEKFYYSNLAFEVLGDVIAKVSGMSFEEYQERFVLDPSGMEESSFTKPVDLPVHWASSHAMGTILFTLDVYPYNRRHAPSSTLHSNALEMSNWAITNLDRGAFKGKRILSSESYESLWDPWVQIEESGPVNHSVGLGWFISDHKGERTIGHDGSDEGFVSNLILVPERSIGIVILANNVLAPVEELTNSALDIILGDEVAPIRPLASIPVWETFNAKDMDEAIGHWDLLKSNHSDEYDFGIQQFYNLYFVMKYERKEDAVAIATLAKNVLPDEEIQVLMEMVGSVREEDPGNEASAAALDVLSGSN